MSLPWFRMYAEFSGDPVIQSLSFDDQRHYVVLLCLKCSGTLDREIASSKREAVIARGLGLDPATADEVKRRLVEVGLIDKSWQPRAWEKRQYRERHSIAPPGDARAYIYFIGPEEGDRVKIGFSKNPWARIKDFQTGTTEQLHVVATVSTTENSEVHIHKLFEELRISGEWYRREGELAQVINEIQKRKLRTDYDVANYVAQLRTTTTDTDTDTDTEADTEAKKNHCAPGGALAGFDRFWKAYPKKKSKGDARKAWKSLKPNEQLQDRIMHALERAKTSADWRKDGGKFIPYPARWLRAEGWEDELQPVRRPDLEDRL